MTSRNVKIVLQLLTTFVILGISALAFAQPAAGEAVAAATQSKGGYVALAAGLGLGIAALGGALGQGRAAATALDGRCSRVSSVAVAPRTVPIRPISVRAPVAVTRAIAVPWTTSVPANTPA